LPALRATPCSVTAQSIEHNDGPRCPVSARHGRSSGSRHDSPCLVPVRIAGNRCPRPT
jgi:hypothetical protein